MAGPAATALCVNLPATEPPCRLRQAANPLQGDKANGKFPVETIVWRKRRGLAAAAFPCFPRFHPLSGAVGYGRYPIHVMVSSACWGQFLMANVVVVGSQWGGG